MNDTEVTAASEYVTVRDGTELAVYTFRPVIDRPVPAVWMHDRYHQISAPPASPDFLDFVGALLGLAQAADPDMWAATPGVASLRSFPWASRLLSEGIAMVVADSRGSGASGGISSGPFALAEVDDMFDITEWIAGQPWCSGKVGMAGRSYLGISQYLAMSAAPPHLVAIFPQMALFDLHGFAHDGGIFRGNFAASWGQIVRQRDCVDPAVAVDSDPDGTRLARNRAAHRQNADVHAMFDRNHGRNDQDPVTGERVYLERSPSERLDRINQSGVAVYNLGGWHDVWVRDSLLWERHLSVPHRTVIGPWSHTSGTAGGAHFNLIDEHARWFGYWLRGKRADGITAPAVLYYAMGSSVRGGWRTASQWPPAGLLETSFYLADQGQLSVGSPPAGALVAEHRVDYAASTGRHSRWSNGYGAPFDYSELTANDAHCAIFGSPPLPAALELVGEVTLRLTLDPVPAGTDVFVTLQCTDAGGDSHYVTEGCLRVGPGQQGDVVIVMQPICWVFDPGDRVRLTLSGADRDNAYTPVADPVPVLRVRGGSVLELPTASARPEPASIAQQSIWLAEQIGGCGSAYHLPAIVEFDDLIDESALVLAINEIIERHEVLRTTLRGDDGTLIQVIHPPAPVDPAVITIAAEADTDGSFSWTADKRVRSLIDKPFDLAQERPLRVGLVQLPAGRTAVVIVVHHVAGDQQAVATFFTELAELYAARIAGRQARLPDLAGSYAAAAERQRTYVGSPAGKSDLDYWREHLREPPEALDLPLDRQRGDRLDPLGDHADTELGEELTAAVRRLAARSRSSLYAVLLTAYSITIGAFAATGDLVVAVPNMDRDSAAERALIGCFVNVLPVRIRFDARQTLDETLRSVRSTLLDSLRHRRVPFDSIVAAASARRGPAIQPLTQTSLRMTQPLPSALPFGPTIARPRPVESGHVKYDLAATVEEAGRSLRVRFEFRTALLDAFTVRSMVETFARVLERMTNAPDSLVATSCAPLTPEVVDIADLDPLVWASLTRDGVRPPGGGVAYVLSASQATVPAGAWGYLHLANLPGAEPVSTGLRARVADVPPRIMLAPGIASPSAEPAHDTAGEQVASDGVSSALTVLSPIWGDLLGQAEPHGSDDFFAFGGDSLLAIRLIGRVRKATGVRLSLRDIFAAPTLGALARMLADRKGAQA